MGVINIKKEILIGFLLALLVHALGFYLYLAYFSGYGFEEGLKMTRQFGILPKVICLSALPNLLIFFLYLTKNHIYRARGVVMQVLFTTLIVFGIQIL